MFLTKKADYNYCEDIIKSDVVEYGQADYSFNDLLALQWLLYPVMGKFNFSYSAISQKENKVLISLVDDTYKDDLIKFIIDSKIDTNKVEFVKNSPRDVELNADYSGRKLVCSASSGNYHATIGGPIGTEYGLNMGSKMLDLLGITATGTTYGTDPTVYYIKGCKATNIYGAIANLYMP